MFNLLEKLSLLNIELWNCDGSKLIARPVAVLNIVTIVTGKVRLLTQLMKLLLWYVENNMTFIR